MAWGLRQSGLDLSFPLSEERLCRRQVGNRYSNKANSRFRIPNIGHKRNDSFVSFSTYVLILNYLHMKMTDPVA